VITGANRRRGLVVGGVQKSRKTHQKVNRNGRKNLTAQNWGKKTAEVRKEWLVRALKRKGHQIEC